MSIESCDRCGDTDADNYYDCENCHRLLCERCYGNITLTVCKSCDKDPAEGKAIAEQSKPKHSDMIRYFNSLLDNLDIEKELNNYSEEEAKGWFLALNKIRGKLNNEIRI